jgi:hypothetical protein
MDDSSQITVSLKPELYQSVLKMNSFKPGSTVRLKVLELRGDRALIHLGKFRATADIKIPVILGEELQAKVLASGRQLRLRVINPEPKNPSPTDLVPQRQGFRSADRFRMIQTDLKQVINLAMDPQSGKKLPQSILNILSMLNSYFEPFSLKESIIELTPKLRSYLENSGLFFEKRFGEVIAGLLAENDTSSRKTATDLSDVKAFLARDLKANLLMLQQFAEDKETWQKFFDSRTQAILKSSIDTLLGDITHQQGRAVKQMAASESFQIFAFALPLKDGEQSARLKVFYEKKQKSESKKGFQISLLLSMNRLGDIRTDLFLLKNDLTMTFFVAEPSSKTIIQKNYAVLQELLNNFFDRVSLKVLVSKKKVMDFDHENVSPAGDKRVDLRI